MRVFKKINKKIGTNYKDDSEIKWAYISRYKILSEDFIKEFQNEIRWYSISIHQILSESFIKKFRDKVDWNNVSECQKLSEPFIKEFQDKVDWSRISRHQKLSENFIREYAHKVDWYDISVFQKLSEDFIKEFQDYVHWKSISKYQKLSEDFIQEFQNKVYWPYIFKHQKLSKSFVKEFNDEPYISLIMDNWIYKSTEKKKQALINTGKYECHDDYFIAYKAIRNDRYSLYNFQYQYLPNEEYESWCDCSNNESSFGLSVGTYDYCKNYLDDNLGIIVKCQVKYEDIGRIAHNGEKIRCLKIKILE